MDKNNDRYNAGGDVTFGRKKCVFDDNECASKKPRLNASTTPSRPTHGDTKPPTVVINPDAGDHQDGGNFDEDLDDTLLSMAFECASPWPASSPNMFEDRSSSCSSVLEFTAVASDGGTVAAKVIKRSSMIGDQDASLEESGDEMKLVDSKRVKTEHRPGVTTQMVANLLGNAFKTAVITNQALAMSKQQEEMEVAMAEAAFLCDLSGQTQDVPSVKSTSSDFYGLPMAVKDLLTKHKGIDRLYDWQDECLRLPAIAQRRNLVYSLPTSGGKTLVAEILMWREVLCRQKDALLILPYISIVQEKVQSMSSFAIELNFSVEEYAGSKGQIPPRTHRKKRCIYIATIEKAHTLVNVLVEHGRLSEIGLVVVDEFHMIGDGEKRGATLESLLTKLLFVSDPIMIVGMSATLGNISDLSRFLDAEVYCRNFRPVELKEYIKIGNDIYSVDPNASSDDDLITKCRTCSFTYTKEMVDLDPDCLGALVREVVPNNSCLIFCPSRKNCENVARMICKTLPSELKSFKFLEKLELYETLKSDGNGKVCEVLRYTLPYGVAYHHSGLTVDERRLLEEAYSAGTLCCITCTSTLAAGVNLPAKRVIVRSPYIGAAFITHSKLKQMIGRAGRAGIDTSGESYLIVKSGDEQRVGELLRVKVEECLSSLALDKNKGLKTLLLSAYGLKLIKTEEDAMNLIAKTLYCIQNGAGLNEAIVKEALNDLCELRLLECEEPASDKCWTPSKLGRATFKGGINLDVAKTLYDDLKLGLKSLALNSYLHLLYLITPYEMVDTTRPIPNVYYRVYTSLPPADLEVAQLIGITEACMSRVLVGQKCRSVSESVLRRFYMTLVLNDLWQQNSIWDVAQKYQLPRGHVQNLLSSSASFATSVLHFCQELEEMWAYQDLLSSFVKRLSHCVHTELIPLMELPCIKQKLIKNQRKGIYLKDWQIKQRNILDGRARLLYEAGYKRLDLVAQCDPEELVRNVTHMPRKIAWEVVTAAKVLVQQRVDALQEEAEELISSLRSAPKV